MRLGGRSLPETGCGHAHGVRRQKRVATVVMTRFSSKSWRGRIKKWKPETVSAELRQTPTPCVPPADEANTMTDEVSRCLITEAAALFSRQSSMKSAKR